MIQFWVLPHYGFETAPVLRAHLREFERAHPGMEVNVTVWSYSSLWRRLVAIMKRPERLPAGDARPDLVQIPSHWTSTLAQLGLLEELSRIDPASLDRWIPLLRGHCLLSGTPRVFSLPWFMEIWALYYRDDILRRARVDPEKLLSSWEGLAECCRILSRRAGAGRLFHPMANSNPRESISLSDVAPSVWSRGGDFFAGDRSLLHRAETLEGIRAYVDLLERGWMPFLGKSGRVPENLFDGRAAMQFSGRFPRKLPARLYRSLRTSVYPSGSAEQTGIVTASHLALVRDGSSPEEVYELLRYLTDGDAPKRYSAEVGAFPASRDWAESAFSGTDHVAEAFRGAFERARTLPNLPFMATLERIFDRSMERIVRDILRRSYRAEALHREMLYAAAEMDYVFSFHASEGGPRPFAGVFAPGDFARGQQSSDAVSEGGGKA